MNKLPQMKSTSVAQTTKGTKFIVRNVTFEQKQLSKSQFYFIVLMNNVLAWNNHITFLWEFAISAAKHALSIAVGMFVSH